MAKLSTMLRDQYALRIRPSEKRTHTEAEETETRSSCASLCRTDETASVWTSEQRTTLRIDRESCDLRIVPHTLMLPELRLKKGARGKSKGDSRNADGRGHPVNGPSPIAISDADNGSAYIAHEQYGWEKISAVHFDFFGQRERLSGNNSVALAIRAVSLWHTDKLRVHDNV